MDVYFIIVLRGRLAQLPRGVSLESQNSVDKETLGQGKLIIKYGVCGRLAQLVERLPYKERVRSSSLLTPTIISAIQSQKVDDKMPTFSEVE